MRWSWVALMAFVTNTNVLAYPQASIIPRDDDDPGVDANNDALVAAIKAANLDPWVPPSDKVIHEWTAIGDSFTAGIGSDGSEDLIDGARSCSRYKGAYPVQMNADGRWGDPLGRKLNFPACTGDKMDDLVSNQPGSDYHAFGKPQIAVMTIGGNDLGFFDVINNCVIRAWGFPVFEGCENVLKRVESQISSMDFLEKLDNTIMKIVEFGRAAGGANPPNSFQLYMLGYVPFWNEDDPGCNEVSFEFWKLTNQKYFLTQDLRKRMNYLVNILNIEFKRAAFRLASYGVVYVEGFQKAYEGHQFCEPMDGSSLESPISENTWFWHKQSPWENNDGPVPGDPTTQAASNSSNDLASTILTYLVPDQGQRNSILNGDDPSKYSNAFTNQSTFDAAINRLPSIIPEHYRRVFHPKKNAYWHQADFVMNTVIVDYENKAASAAQASLVPAAPSSPSPPPVPSPAGDICGAWYNFWYDSFQIYGKNFDSSKLGDNGAGLLHNLRHCGDVSDWSFEPRTNDPQGYEWLATGRLPIGTKSCIGSAVVYSGGQSADGCTGAG